MASYRHSTGFAMTISGLQELRATPTVRTVANNFDYIGGLLSLGRIPGEDNIAYRNRLFDVQVHPGGPLYEGVVNGLARSLGFVREKTLLIDLKSNYGYNLASNPRVDILANRVVLYESWTNPDTYTIDKEIYFYDRDSAGYYLEDLVDEINSSDCFSADIYSGIRTNLHSFTLVRGTSTTFVYNQLIRGHKMNKLLFANLLQDTVWFEEKDIFTTEVTSTPSSAGEYKIDYTNGLIESYSIPSGNGRCGYKAASFPLKVDSVPVQVFSLHDEDFTEELFRQELQESGSYVNGLPNGEGAEIYHQLFDETKVFWGE